MPTVNWIPDELAVAKIKSTAKIMNISVRLDVEHLTLQQLQVKASRSNNARVEENSLDDDLVWRIAESMEAGIPIPYIVCTTSGYILGGNHRVGATDLFGAEEVVAHVVKNATKPLQDMIARSLNLVTGEPPKDDERISHAIEVFREGYKVNGAHIPLSTIATHFNVKFERLREAIEERDVRKSLFNANVDTSLVNSTHVKSIKRFANQPKVLVRVGEIVAGNRLSTEETEDLVKKVATKTTAKDRILEADNWRSFVSRHKPDTRSKNADRDRLWRKLKDLTDFVNEGKKTGRGKNATRGPFESLEDFGIETEDDRLRYQRVYREGKKTLDEIFRKALRKSKKK